MEKRDGQYCNGTRGGGWGSKPFGSNSPLKRPGENGVFIGKNPDASKLLRKKRAEEKGA